MQKMHKAQENHRQNAYKYESLIKSNENYMLACFLCFLASVACCAFFWGFCGPHPAPTQKLYNTKKAQETTESLQSIKDYSKYSLKDSVKASLEDPLRRIHSRFHSRFHSSIL